MEGATNGRAVINLTTGHEDADRVTVAFLVGPICFDARRLAHENIVPNARIAGATPLWEFVGEGATVFSY